MGILVAKFLDELGMLLDLWSSAGDPLKVDKDSVPVDRLGTIQVTDEEAIAAATAALQSYCNAVEAGDTPGQQAQYVAFVEVGQKRLSLNQVMDRIFEQAGPIEVLNLLDILERAGKPQAAASRPGLG